MSIPLRSAPLSNSCHPALRRTHTGCPLDAKRCKWHVIGVRCAAPMGTHHIWREIWLDRRRISRGWWVDSTPVRAAVLAQPVRSKTCSMPHDLRHALAEADASFKSTMQARGTDWAALSNGRGQVAGSPTVKRLNALNFYIISDLASSYPTRFYHSIVAPWDTSSRVRSCRRRPNHRVVASNATAGRQGGVTGVPAVASTVLQDADVTSEQWEADGTSRFLHETPEFFLTEGY